jgi:predicted RNase H-like nuclease (RuvC/YqgF family)
MELLVTALVLGGVGYGAYKLFSRGLRSSSQQIERDYDRRREYEDYSRPTPPPADEGLRNEVAQLRNDMAALRREYEVREEQHRREVEILKLQIQSLQLQLEVERERNRGQGPRNHN